uniref:Uncharacterized protein n=1 Tax=Rhodothermus marinus TaxID=29549 RepID=A0A7V2AZV4_RHOMR
MFCPRCADDRLLVVRTIRVENLILRRRRCDNCGLFLETEERIVRVEVYRPSRYESEWVDLERWEAGDSHVA